MKLCYYVDQNTFEAREELMYEKGDWVKIVDIGECGTAFFYGIKKNDLYKVVRATLDNVWIQVGLYTPVIYTSRCEPFRDIRENE